MTPKQQRILTTLRNEQGPLTVAEIAEQAAISSATVRTTVARWEKEGTVERVSPSESAGARYGYRWRLKDGAAPGDRSGESNPTRAPERARQDGSPDAINAAVGARLRRARMELGMSQTELANLLGVSFQQVQKYEQGNNALSASRLLYVANALRKPVSYFFDADNRDDLIHDALSDAEAFRLARHYVLLPKDKRDAIRAFAIKVAHTYGGSGGIE